VARALEGRAPRALVLFWGAQAASNAEDNYEHDLVRKILERNFIDGPTAQPTSSRPG